MPKNRNPTAYLFVNKDSASVSRSRSHGKDASAILSHVQSCRNQKNKQLHMFQVDGTPESVPKISGPQLPLSPSSSSPTSTPTSRRDTSSSSNGSASPGLRDQNASARPPESRIKESSLEVEELVHYFDLLCLSSELHNLAPSQSQDLYHQLVSSQDFRNFSGQVHRSTHRYATLACTAAKMGADMPLRREEFEIKAIKYMQPSLRCLREQLAKPQTRKLTNREILQEMLLHCVTNWYLRDFSAAQTHLDAINWCTSRLDVSRSSDRKLMDIINLCGLYVTNAQRAEQLHEEGPKKPTS